MTLKELKNKLDKLSKACKDDTEVLIYSKSHEGDSFQTPNTIVVKSSIDKDGKEVEKIYIQHK